MGLKSLLKNRANPKAACTVKADEALFAKVREYLDDTIIPEGVRLAPMMVEGAEFDAWPSADLVCEACEPCVSPEDTASFPPIPEAPEQSASPAPWPVVVAGAAGAPCKEAPCFQPERADLSDLLANLDEGFSTTLLHLIDARGLTDAQVYKRANLSRQHFSKIRKDSHYKPTKRTAFALAVALELSLDETEDLLSRAGFAISHSNEFDVILEYFIRREIYDVFVINETLFDFDQPLLGQ